MRRDERRDDLSPAADRRRQDPQGPRRRGAASWKGDPSNFGAASGSGYRAGEQARYRSSGRVPVPDAAGAPHVTLPTFPRVARGPTPEPGRSGTGRRPAAPRVGRPEGSAPESYGAPRQREHSAARALTPRTSGKRPVVVSGRKAARPPAQYGAPERYDGAPYDDWDQAAIEEEWQIAEDWEASGRWSNAVVPYQSTQRAPVPALAAYRAPMRRPVVMTQAILRRARSPWSLARMALAVAAIIATMVTTFVAAGEPSQRYQAFATGLAGNNRTQIIAQLVQPLTSLLRPDQFDSSAQFNTYSPAACSPAALAMVLTAWGVPHATIGQMIDDLGPDLSPYAGLLTQDGFQVAAAKHNMRADISWHLTYNQMLYLTNSLGIPVIVNFRQAYGYYHYFAGGHFVVVTGGDQQGVSIADSSEYFIKYLPHDVFDGLWQWRGDGTAMTVVIVPADFHYTLPNV
jgi:predicted double-glycine peptidase